MIDEAVALAHSTPKTDLTWGCVFVRRVQIQATLATGTRLVLGQRIIKRDVRKSKRLICSPVYMWTN